MYPGKLDLLHDGRDAHILTIADAVYVHLKGVFQKAVNEDGGILRHLDGETDIAVKPLTVVDDGHCPAPQHIGGTHHHRIADPLCNGESPINRARRAVLRHRQADLVHERPKALAVFSEVNGIRRSAQDRHARIGQLAYQLEWRLPAKLDDDSLWFLQIADVKDVFQSQRLKVQPIADVIVCGDRFRVTVGHDRLVAQLLKGERALGAAVIELDSLTNAVRATPQDDDLPPLGGLSLAQRFIGAIQIGRIRRELGRAGIHAREDRAHPQMLAIGAHIQFLGRRHNQPSDERIAHARLLGLAHEILVNILKRSAGDPIAQVTNCVNLP